MENYALDSSISRAIRITPAEYFLNNSIHMHGEDIIMFGDGSTIVIFLKQPVPLKIQS
jgi:hypothetical protein